MGILGSNCERMGVKCEGIMKPFIFIQEFQSSSSLIPFRVHDYYTRLNSGMATLLLNWNCSFEIKRNGNIVINNFKALVK